MPAPSPNRKDPTMNETEILRGQLMRKLRRAIDTTVKIDTGGEQAIEVAATALTDVLAEVLVRLPAAKECEGGQVISGAMYNRLCRRMAAETLITGTPIDFSYRTTAIAAG